jgi:hypothetical protein
MTVVDYRSAVDERRDLGSRLAWLGWAVYLGMSWTWCIGMFLPVLLVRDYGVWGWIVFAIPNVVGAAAMGWIVRDGPRSLQLLHAHVAAAVAFTLVTVAFQFYFVGWWTGAWGGWRYTAAGLTVLLIVLFAGRHGHLIAAALTLLFSLIVAATFLTSGVPSLPAPTHRAWPDLLFLAPVCAFGFLLCPYLDLTFHKARLETLTPLAGRIAFTIGFGGFFATMILFTLAYSGVAIAPGPGLLLTLIVLHMSVQIAFTVLVHFDAVRTLPVDAWKRRSGFALIAAAATGAAIGALTRHLGDYHDLSAGEVGYRLFMAFYGLGFPAYVWLCMIPSPSSKPSRRSLAVFAAAVLLAAPFYWLGFIEGRMFWLLPGLLIVLCLRVTVPRSR